MSPFLCGSPFFIFFLLPPMSLDSSGDENLLYQSRTCSGTSDFFPFDQIHEDDIWRKGVFTWWSLFPRMSTRWLSDVFGTIAANSSMTHYLVFVCFGSIKSWLFTHSGKYLLWNARTSWSKHVWSFLILLFSFLNRPFYPDTYRTSLWRHYWFAKHFFYFCNICLFLIFRNSSDVARRNIFYYIAVLLQSPFATLQHKVTQTTNEKARMSNFK